MNNSSAQSISKQLHTDELVRVMHVAEVNSRISNMRVPQTPAEFFDLASAKNDSHMYPTAILLNAFTYAHRYH